MKKMKNVGVDLGRTMLPYFFVEKVGTARPLSRPYLYAHGYHYRKPVEQVG